jgi:AraC-like DNA-binding protein
VRRVCERIAAELTGGTPTAERVAAKLHMSTRRLGRRLDDEGTSSSTLLDDLRKALAVSHLRDRDISVSEVAFLLGFAGANAFSRAFKRWIGEPPSHFRRTE